MVGKSHPKCLPTDGETPEMGWPADKAGSVRNEDTGVMTETIVAMAGPKIVDQVVRACSVAMKIPGSLKP